MSKSVQFSPRNRNASYDDYADAILTCTGSHIAAKTHRRRADGNRFTDSFNAGMYFEHEEVPFYDLHGLLGVIAEAAKNPEQFVIRGRLKADAPMRQDGSVRRTSRRQSNGEEPYFEDANRA